MAYEAVICGGNRKAALAAVGFGKILFLLLGKRVNGFARNYGYEVKAFGFAVLLHGNVLFSYPTKILTASLTSEDKKKNVHRSTG